MSGTCFYCTCLDGTRLAEGLAGACRGHAGARQITLLFLQRISATFKVLDSAPSSDHAKPVVKAAASSLPSQIQSALAFAAMIKDVRNMPKRRRATAEEREKVIENLRRVANRGIHWSDLVRNTIARSAGLGLDGYTIHNICLGICRRSDIVRRISRGVYEPAMKSAPRAPKKRKKQAMSERAMRHERAMHIENERLVTRIHAGEEIKKNLPFTKEQSTEPRFWQGGLPGLRKRH